MAGGTVAIKLSIPSEWPVANDMTVLEGKHEDAYLSIIACSDGALLFKIDEHGHGWRRKSAPLKLPAQPLLSIALGWDCEPDIECYINGQAIGSGGDPPLEIASKHYVPTLFREPLAFDVPLDWKEQDEDFLFSVLELQERANGSRNYYRKRAAFILRQLFLDRSTLVERVNRGHKVNLTFSHVSSDRQKIHRLAGAPPLIHSGFIAPLFADPDRIKHSKLQQFLKEPILSSADWSFSVRDIISICANNKGGSSL